MLKQGILIILVVQAVFSCSIDPELKPKPPVEDIQQVVPEGWPRPVYNFDNNPLTDFGFELGRALFYEPQLSRDNTISCGSCHQQFAAFAHSDHALSHGIDGAFGTRNATPLFNLIWNNSFMWDGGVNHIEVQPLAPITNPVEMDDNLTNIINKLKGSSKYRTMFKNAFGSDTITTQRIFYAITQFQGMLVSNNSKYDRYQRGESGVTFTTAEQNGYMIFKQKCASCHREPLFTNYEFINNGIGYNSTSKDSGRAHITGLPEDRFKFKVPSLRNSSVTAPYMHDGRFKTLDQVLNHYTSGISPTENLDPRLQNGIALNAQEKSDLKIFLNTLTDYTFLNDARFKDPN